MIVAFPGYFHLYCLVRGKELVVLRFFLCGLYTVCHGLYALPIGVIGRLYSVIVALPVIYCTMFLLSEAWCRPRWLSWMRRPTGDQEVAGSTPAEVGNILS